jgi:hypothetical protein
LKTTEVDSNNVNNDAGKRLATLAKMESLEVDPETPPIECSKAQQSALYMNVDLDLDIQASDASENFSSPIENTPPTPINNLDIKMNDIKKEYTKNLNGNNFGFNNKMKTSISQESSHCYQNLNLGGSETKALVNQRHRYSRPEIFSKVDLPQIDNRIDKSEPCTPTQRKVNYIVLDLDQSSVPCLNINNTNNNINNINGNNNGSETNFNEIASNSSQMTTSVSLQNGLTQLSESPKKLGYATIDFDRSNALSNILSNTPINDNDQSCRKTRHDSNVTPVLTLTKENNSMSD